MSQSRKIAFPAPVGLKTASNDPSDREVIKIITDTINIFSKSNNIRKLDNIQDAFDSYESLLSQMNQKDYDMFHTNPNSQQSLHNDSVDALILLYNSLGQFNINDDYQKKKYTQRKKLIKQLFQPKKYRIDTASSNKPLGVPPSPVVPNNSLVVPNNSPVVPNNIKQGGKNKRKVSKVSKKDVLGKKRNVYKFIGDKKEYIKYKNEYVLLKKYKEMQKTKSKSKKK
jgi:hypothetical protein